MPTYEYRCPNEHHFEVFQRMSDDPVAACPECGEQAQRLLSGGAGFLFKGDGFYITDYRSDEYKAKAKAEKGESGPGTKEKAGADTSSGGKGDPGDASSKASQTSSGTSSAGAAGSGGTAKPSSPKKGSTSGGKD
jgi:putative FmdB family regulatory protein